MEPSPAQTNGQPTIESAAHIPIAQLTPLLAAPASRSIKAIVTLTWPYSSATGSVAFLLSEPDFRLRRTRGQVRAQFAGSSAKHVAKSGIASGDEVILCLDGVEWVEDDNKVSTPGRGVEFELKFTERLLLQFLPEESQEAQLIDIDHPQQDPEPETVPETRASPEPSTPISLVTNGNSNLIRIDTEPGDDEFSSPAFVKRARTSYGSLYEGIDLFAEEDDTVRGKGRKRTRLSTSWKYSSQSPTPEREESVEVDEASSPEPVVQPRPTMTDDGCQTTPQEVDDAAEALATFSRGAVNVGGTAYAKTDEPTDTQAEVPLGLKISMPPPILQTVFPEEKSQPSTQREAPRSPRLKPQPSEALPLVSPLVSKSLFGFAEPVLPAALPQQNRDQGEHLFEPVQTSIPITEPGDEDLYSASPQRQVDVSTADFSSLQTPLLDVPALGEIGLEGKFVSENQYGEWQRDTANLSYASSPFKQPENPDMIEDERFYVEEGHEAHQFSHDDESTHVEAPISHQYPDLDELPGLHHIPVWGRHATVAYPDLPEHDDRIENDSRIELLPPNSTAMSRSQSNQSQAIDLTESSDEGEQLEGEGVDLKNGSDAEESEGSSIDEEDMPVDGTRSQYFQHDDTRIPQEDYEEDEENYYEDEFEEDEEGIYASRGDYYEDEESDGSYDEDMEGDEGPQAAPVQRDPVVIDLLSSDEEDAGDVPAPKQPTPKPRELTTRPEPASDEESGEDEGMQDDIDDQNFEESKLGQGSFQQERLGSHRSSEEDESELEQDLQDHRHTRVASVGPELDDDDASQDSEFESEVEAGEHNDPTEKDYYFTPKEVQPALVEDNSPDDASSKPQERKSSIQTIPPTLYPGSFGMDGAHDDRVEDYPSERHSEDDKASPEPEIRRNKTNGQLPTPDDTQKTDKAISPEISFSASQDLQVASNAPKSSSDETAILGHNSPIADARGESTNVEIPETSLEVITEPASIPKDTSKSTNQEATIGDQEPETEETIIEEIVEKAKEEALEDIAMEEPETEETIIEDIMETAKEDALKEISMEETARDEPVLEDVMGQATLTPEPVKQNVLELQQKGEEPALVSPRRSSRLVKPTLNLKENVRPSTPTKAAKSIQQTSARSDRTLPLMTVDEQRSSPQGHDASVELALASHDSPQKRHNLRNAPGAEPVSPPSPRNLRKPIIETESTPLQHNLRGHPPTDADTTSRQHDLRKHPVAESNPPTKQHDLCKTSVADLKLQLSRTLRTKLSEFTALKVLRYHLNAKLDVIAVATTTPSEPQRTKSTSRQFLTTFHVTDVSIGPSAVTEVQVFRPYKDALPVIHAGDGILLRNFQVVSVKNRGFGLRSEETSSWAVFKDDEEPEMRGPPVELADEEKNHMALLKQWYEGLGPAAMTKINRANGDKGATT